MFAGAVERDLRAAIETGHAAGHDEFPLLVAVLAEEMQREICRIHHPSEIDIYYDRVGAGRGAVRVLFDGSEEVDAVADSGVRPHEVDMPPFFEGRHEGGGLVVVVRYVALDEKDLLAVFLRGAFPGLGVEVNDRNVPTLCDEGFDEPVAHAGGAAGYERDGGAEGGGGTHGDIFVVDSRRVGEFG